MTYEPAIGGLSADPSQSYDLVIGRARVFDGTTVLDGLHDIAIKGGEIAAVSPEPLVGAHLIDADGGWVIPGLIDTHIHFYNVMAITDPASLDEFEAHERSERLMHFLQRGITTVKSVGDPTSSILATRAKIVSGELTGPRLLATGLGITGRDGHPASTIFSRNPWARARFAGEVGSVQHMRDLVHYLADMKVDAIKLLSEGACACHGEARYVWELPGFIDPVEIERLPKAFLQAGIETAHARGLRVTVHTTQQVAAREVVEAGADALEHGIVNEPITDEMLIEMLVAHDVMVCPTLWAHHAAHPYLQPNLKMLADAGVAIALGSDTFSGRGLYGDNTLEEAELMVAAGLTPLQTLIAGTSNAARQCDRPDIGTLAPGKRADLLLLSDDPTEDISNIRKLKKTVLNGVVVVDKG